MNKLRRHGAGCSRLRRGFGRSSGRTSIGQRVLVEEFELLPGDGDVADDLPAQAAAGSGRRISSRSARSERAEPSGSRKVTLPSAATPATRPTIHRPLSLRRNRIGSPRRRPSRARCSVIDARNATSQSPTGDATLELAHPGEPAVGIGRLELHVAGDLRMGEHEEALLADRRRPTSSATCSGSSTSAAAFTTLPPVNRSSPACSMAVFTPCGHRHVTLMPAVAVRDRQPLGESDGGALGDRVRT